MTETVMLPPHWWLGRSTTPHNLVDRLQPISDCANCTIVPGITPLPANMFLTVRYRNFHYLEPLFGGNSKVILFETKLRG